MDLLTLQQAMQRLGISDSTMRRYIEKEKLPYQKIQGRYYFKESDVNKLLPEQSDASKVINEMVTHISTMKKEIEDLKQQISQLTSQQANLSTHVDEIIEALYALSTPHAAQPQPTTRSEQSKPSVVHPGAIPEELPEGTVTLRELAAEFSINRTTLYEQVVKNELDHISIPLATLGKPGSGDERFFTPEQAQAVRNWRATRPSRKRERGPGDD